MTAALVLSETVEKTAILSACERFRYRLGRRWDNGATMLFVMLNPSKADASIDDPTIVRCMGFARREGCAAIDVVNLFAYRSTHPSNLAGAVDPVGPDNDSVIRGAADNATLIVLAWGAFAASNAKLCYRPRQVLRLLRARDRTVTQLVYALGTTQDGHPRHPLYLPKNAPLSIFASEDV